jgi:hypothetical protein
MRNQQFFRVVIWIVVAGLVVSLVATAILLFQ